MKGDFRVVFIGGAGRTGTNVLRDILSLHPKVASLPFESRITVDPDGVCHTLHCLRNSWSPFVSEVCIKRHFEFLEKLRRRNLLDKIAIVIEKAIGQVGVKCHLRRYKEWELGEHFPFFEEHMEKLRSDLCLLRYKGVWPGTSPKRVSPVLAVGYSDNDGHVSCAFGKFLRNLYWGYSSSSNKNLYVDDNTFNAVYSSSLLDLLPKAKIINVVRDPRDVVSSYLRQRWTPNDVPQAVRYHKEVVHAWWRSRSELHSDNYLEVKLEEMVHSPKKSLMKVCDFSGIEFDPNLLSVDLSKHNSGRWSRDISEEWHGHLNNELDEILREYDYI